MGFIVPSGIGLNGQKADGQIHQKPVPSAGPKHIVHNLELLDVHRQNIELLIRVHFQETGGAVVKYLFSQQPGEHIPLQKVDGAPGLAGLLQESLQAAVGLGQRPLVVDELAVQLLNLIVAGAVRFLPVHLRYVQKGQ